jgi:hypothetical protein
MKRKEFNARLGVPPSFKRALKSFEHDLLQTALNEANKSPTKAARLVGLRYQTFIKRLAKHKDIERSPIRKRRKTLMDYYIIISNVGPNPLNVAKIIAHHIPDQDQSRIIKTISTSENINFKAPNLGRAQRVTKLLRRQRASVTIESVPNTEAEPTKSLHASNSRN